MHRTNMYFPADLFKRMRSFSKLSGMPIAEMVRRAVADFLEKHKAD